MGVIISNIKGTPIVKVKTAELSGRALDWSVGKALGIDVISSGGEVWKHFSEDELHAGEDEGLYEYRPSFDWSQCGSLITEYQIFIDPPHEVHKSMVTPDGKPKGCWQSYDTWHATISTTVAEKPSKHLWADFSLPGGPYRGEGEPPLIAICRALVASKLGDEVDIPDELMEVGE